MLTKDTIIAMHRAGKSPSEIVKALGCTKGTVAGVINRYRKSIGKPRGFACKLPVLIRGNPTLPADPKQCLWLGGKIREHETCDCDRMPGKPYCAAHMKRAYKFRSKGE